MIDLDLAEETQFSTGLGKGQNRNGVPIDIAQPTHIGLGLDRQQRTFDMHIVSLARPKQRLVGTERDGCTVMIFRFVGYTDALHKES